MQHSRDQNCHNTKVNYHTKCIKDLDFTWVNYENDYFGSLLTILEVSSIFLGNSKNWLDPYIRLQSQVRLVKNRGNIIRHFSNCV
jgi:hypothetical protein